MGHFGSRPVRLAWSALVLPALALNYFGQGALLIADPQGGRESVLPAGAGVGALPARRARDRGDDHRVAGGDLRRLFDHAAGDAAGLCAADGGPAHVEPRNRPDLPARHQSDAVRRRRRAGAGLRHRRRASRRPTASRSPARWRSRRCWHSSSRGGCGMEPARVRRALRRVPARRRRVLQRQSREDRRRRLVSAGVRPRRVRADVDLEARPGAAPSSASRPTRFRCRISCKARRWDARPFPVPPSS